MRFASDNWSGASEPVLAALTEAARQGGPAYGGDALTQIVGERFNTLFERDVTVLLVGTGTAANTLALRSAARPGGLVFCHADAHINVDEAGALEAAGIGKIVTVAARQGKIVPDALAEALGRFPPGASHHGQPAALSVTQSTELGAVYTPDEVSALAALAHARDMVVHMDGARIANAAAATGRSLADLTWRAGVDVLSFGGTKNGCVAAEAVVFFDPDLARHAAFARQQAGHGFSKAWFIAAQFAATLADDHWLALAGHANRAAAGLAETIRRSPEARLAWAPEANEVFAILSGDAAARLKSAGALFHPWSADSLPEFDRPREDELLIRLVTSWQTTAEEVERFASTLGA